MDVKTLGTTVVRSLLVSLRREEGVWRIALGGLPDQARGWTARARLAVVVTERRHGHGCAADGLTNEGVPAKISVAHVMTQNMIISIDGKTVITRIELHQDRPGEER